MLKAFHRIPFFSSSYCYYSSVHYQVLHSKKLKEFSLGENSDKAVLQYQEITENCILSILDKAVLQYKEIAPSVILLEHTIVPESLQGKGFGKLLAEAAFEYAIDQNLKVKISCGFVKKYLEKNPKPEFLKVLSND